MMSQPTLDKAIKEVSSFYESLVEMRIVSSAFKDPRGGWPDEEPDELDRKVMGIYKDCGWPLEKFRTDEYMERAKEDDG